MNILFLLRKNFFYFLPLFLVISRSIAEVCVIVLGLSFLYHSYKSSNWGWLNEAWVKLSYIFILYLLFSSLFFSFDKFDSLIYSITFIRWPLFACALYFLFLKDFNNLKKFYLGIVFFFIFFIIDLWAQFISGTSIFGYESINKHLTGLLRDNLISGRFLTYYFFCFLSLIIILNLIKNKKKENLVIYLTIFIIFLTLSITGERMVFISFLLSITVFFIAKAIETKKIIFLLFFSILLLSSIILLKEFFPYIFDSSFNRLFSETLYKLTHFNESDYGIVFRTSYDAWFNNNIWFGDGLHQFKFVCCDELIKQGNENAKILHAHNIPLNLLVETGLIGLFLFYSIIISVVYSIFKKIKNDIVSLYLCLNLVLIYFFPFFTHFSFTNNYINPSIWLLIALALTLTNYYAASKK